MRKYSDNKKGSLLLVEDEKADQHIVKQAFSTLKIANEIVIVENGEDALRYLRNNEVQPILILCDINMPKMNGIELRAEIYKDLNLRKKCIPFIFISTSTDEKQVELAFDYGVQGYFEKPRNFHEAVDLLKLIIAYWKKCKNPNSALLEQLTEIIP